MTTPDWHLHAACAEGDVNARWFFPDMPSGRPSAAVHARTDEAKAVCGRCDVREECLADALADPWRYGIWGGLTRAEREGLRQEGRAS